MSKDEIEKFARLLRDYRNGEVGGADALHSFLLAYEQPLINALRFYAADK